MLYFAQSLDFNLAHDIVQETFYRAMKNYEKLEELNEKQQKSWLFKTARNIFVDNIRKLTHKAFEEIREDMMHQSDDYFELYIDDLNLDFEDKKLFLLRYVYGYNSKEIGKMLDLNAETIRSKLFYIRKKLKKEISYE